jgi:hypothetical protein
VGDIEGSKGAEVDRNFFLLMSARVEGWVSGELTVEVWAGKGLDYGEPEEEVSRANPAFSDDVSIGRGLVISWQREVGGFPGYGLLSKERDNNRPSTKDDSSYCRQFPPNTIHEPRRSAMKIERGKDAEHTSEIEIRK